MEDHMPFYWTLYWKLRTATGDSENVLGEMHASLNIESATIRHCVLVVDIEENVILGADIMKKCGYKLDLKNGVLRANEEDLTLYYREDANVRIVVLGDSTLPVCIGMIVSGSPDEI